MYKVNLNYKEMINFCKQKRFFQIIKKTIIFIIFLIFILPQGIANPVYIAVEKSGGSRKWYSFWKITYNYVRQDPCYEIDENDYIYKLTCKDQGIIEGLLFAFEEGEILINQNIYSEKDIIKHCNKLIRKTDKKILKGINSGDISKTVNLLPKNSKKTKPIKFLSYWEDIDVKSGNINYIIRIGS